MRLKLWLSIVVLVLAAASSSALAQSAPKIAVFDAQRVSEETAEGKRVSAGLDGFRNKKQAELTAKEQQLTDLQNQLESQALALSTDRRAALEKDIQRKVLELNQLREAAAREFQLEVNEAQTAFQEKLLAVIQQFGQAEGFDLILELSLVAYAGPSVDVTTALIDRFNAAFPVNPGGGE